MGATLTHQPKVGVAGNQDFWLFYNPGKSGNIIKDVISALYYLPENFKLMITGARPDVAMHIPLNHEILNRVRYENSEELSGQAALLSSADAVLYEGKTKSINSTPSVVIDNSTSKDIARDDSTHYTVSAHNPAAIASAALNISRIAN